MTFVMHSEMKKTEGAASLYKQICLVGPKQFVILAKA